MPTRPSIRELTRDPAARPWAVAAAVLGLFAGAGIYSAWARSSFPRIPPAPNTLGIISRTTDAGYSTPRDVAVLGSGVAAGAAASVAGVALWILAAGTCLELGGSVVAAARGATLGMAPLGLLGPVLLQSPQQLGRQLAVHVGATVVLLATSVVLHGRFGEPLQEHAREHPDALGFVMGMGLVWGLAADLWLDARRPAGWRGWLLCLAVGAACASWLLVARAAALLRREPVKPYLAPAAHALAPTLLLGLYPFLYLGRHPLRVLAALSLAWSVWRLRSTFRFRPDPLGPTRVLAPYVRGLLVPLLLALAAFDPSYADHPQGRDMLFYAEEGQHLAWANRILDGQTPGKDFFMLYGPLLEYGHAAWLALFGTTVAESRAYFEALRIAGVLAAYGFGHLLLGGALGGAIAALVLVQASISFRVAFGLGTLALLFRASEEKKPGLAGTGLALAVLGLMSQEVAAAALLATILYLLVEPRARGRSLPSALKRLTGGIAVVLAVFAAWLVAHGALRATVDNMVSYPRYVTMGYANAPYPPLQVPALTPQAAARVLFATSTPLVWYVPPVLYLLGLVLALLPDPRRIDVDRARLAALSLFGLVLFRAALGRSGPGKIVYVMPPAILVLLWIARRSLHALTAGRPAPTAVGGPGLAQVLGGAGTLLAATLLVGPALLARADAAFRQLAYLAPPEARGLAIPAHPRLQGSGALPGAVAPAVAAATLAEQRLRPGEPLLAIPNDAVLYFLADRRNPTRFDLFSQIVTDAHRREVREALEKDPPKLVLYDQRITRVDGIPDHRQFPEALGFLWDRYDLDRTLGPFLVLVPSSSQHPAARGAAPPPAWDFRKAPWVLIGGQDEAHPERLGAEAAFVPGGLGPFRADLSGMSTRRVTRLAIEGAFAGRGIDLTIEVALPSGSFTRKLVPVADGRVHEVELDLADGTAWPFLGPAQALTITPAGSDVTKAELHRVRFLPRPFGDAPPTGTAP